MTEPSADQQAKFGAAVARSKTLKERPDNVTLLRLYALYKQASEGDLQEPKPGALDFVASAKWSARDALRGVSRAEAMGHYIALVDSLA